MAVLERDITDVKVGKLFTVRFLHSGYGFSRRKLLEDSLTLEPDNATGNLFTNHQIGYHFFNDTLICFIRTDLTQLLSPPVLSPETPFIKFTGNVSIRFLINASADFLNKTVVEAAGATQVYQFTNQLNAGAGGFICMNTAGVNNSDLKNSNVINADQTCFAVVDVHSNGAVNNTYDLFADINQTLKSPNYFVQFISKI